RVPAAARRPTPFVLVHAATMPDDPARMIDVRSLMRELSVEELCATAEEYFRRLTNLDYHLAKPFASVDEAPELVISFMHVLLGLKLAPEMVVLDFGAGSCWSSRYLTQLGMEVIAMEEIGRASCRERVEGTV